jgi:PAS domain-containing protein
LSREGDNLPEEQVDEPASEEAGIFTWDVRSNVLFGDSAVAKHFGLSEAEVAAGLPLESYLKRVHEADKPLLELAIKKTINSKIPYRAEYRTLSIDGNWTRVMAFGRCFYSSDGKPSSFSGIIHPVPEDSAFDDTLLWHLLSALTIAKTAGNVQIADDIYNVLSKVGLADPSKRDGQRIIN